MELAALTTLGLGGPAGRLEAPTHQAALLEVVRAVPEAELLVLGGGSNLVVADAGFGGTVLHLGRGFSAVSFETEGEVIRVTAEAGASWDELVAESVARGLCGLEALSGIPGSVGATPVQNVGAYGQEVADTLLEVEAYDRQLDAVVRIPRDDCAFAYRHSRFRGSRRFVILRVAFGLASSPDSTPLRYAELCRALGVAEGGRAPLARVRETVIALRRGKGMVLDPGDADSRSAGSFFTNPLVSQEQAEQVAERARALGITTPMPRFAADAGRVKLSAAWLLERAGFRKGHGAGRIGVSSKHSLALVHRGGGSTAELLELARALRAGVAQCFGVVLEPEPVFVGCAL